jgi:hypothetical protein
MWNIVFCVAFKLRYVLKIRLSDKLFHHGAFNIFTGSVRDTDLAGSLILLLASENP